MKEKKMVYIREEFSGGGVKKYSFFIEEMNEEVAFTINLDTGYLHSITKNTMKNFKNGGNNTTVELTLEANASKEKINCRHHPDDESLYMREDMIFCSVNKKVHSIKYYVPLDVDHTFGYVWLYSGSVYIGTLDFLSAEGEINIALKKGQLWYNKEGNIYSPYHS